MKRVLHTAVSISNLSKLLAQLSVGVLLLSLFPSLPAAASQITTRSLTVGSSASVASTTHNFTFTAPSATTVESLTFQYCTTASGSCTTPSGLVTTGATLASTSNLGSGGSWTATVTTNGTLKIANASNTGSPSASATVNFSSVTNPTLSGNGTVYYVRITTYSDAAWTTSIDTGNVAGAVTNQIQVTASVDESLDFCAFQTGTTCGGGSGTTVALGTLSSSAATTATSKLVAGTNAGTGYTIQYTGATLTGPSTIAATGTSGATSTTGSPQFGINVANNTAPTVGAAPSGGGSGSTNYNAANTFSYVASTLTQIASAGGSSADTLYTVSYLANIPANQPAGAYSTTLTYICTSTF